MHDVDLMERLLNIAMQRSWYERKYQIYRNLIFVMGAPGSGKTSMCKILEDAWQHKGISVVNEVGGSLRSLSQSESDTFELPFEFTVITLEMASMATFGSITYHGDNTIIVDGGILQNYAHMTTRIKNVDKRMKNLICIYYTELMDKCFMPFTNAYFIILSHRERIDYNKTFEGMITGAMTFIERYEGTIGMKSLIISPEQITRYIQKVLPIPDMRAFLERFGNFEKLC